MMVGQAMRGMAGIWLPLVLVLLTMTASTLAWTEGEVLNVHVVPHSHNDPGWWYTFEKYYQDWTKGIISSVVEVLAEKKERKFIWAEISYFQRWWQDQSSTVKDTVKRLVRDGQLEFVTAGWVMNDEANTHMVDIINQLTEGHEWLYSTLQTKPRFGWAIDPFGHSPTMPYVLHHMDFEGIVINRAHRTLKEDFRNKKHLEFMWHGDQLTGSSSFNMLTHMLPWKLYDIPNTCGPDWDLCASFDFERPVAITITNDNVRERAQALIKMYKEKAKLFRHNSVLIPLGDDFKYKTVDMTKRMMTQYEMLFDYINSHKDDFKVNIQFSTLGEYFADLSEYKSSSSQGDALPSYHGDFFTYCDEGQDYWSGYFTTRPFMKGLTRSVQAILRTGEVLATLAQVKFGSGESGSGSLFGFGGAVKLKMDWEDRLESARRNLGLFQHHDGVTGTARRAVVDDYANRLFDSLKRVSEMACDMALYIISDKEAPTEQLKWTTEPSSGSQRVLDVTKEGGVVVVFNSLGHTRAEVVTLEVNNHNVAVLDGEGEMVVAQVDPVWEGAKPSSKKFTLHFLAEVEGIGLNTYFIKLLPRYATLSNVVVYVPDPSSGEQVAEGWNYESKMLSESSPLSIENSEYRIQLTGNGAIKKITRLASSSSEQVSSVVEQTFASYGSNGGAYLFLPHGPAQTVRTSTGVVRVVTGPLVSTVSSKTESAIKDVVVRLYECYSKDSSDQKQHLPCPQSLGVEVLHTVELIEGNTEIVALFDTDIATEGRFYTDSNGLDMRERRYDSNLPIQGNYYPITSAAYIESRKSKVRFTALSHQAHGATSLKDGDLEIMLDRRLNRDDARGLQEPIMDNVRTLIPLWLVLESIPAPDLFVHPALSQAASDVWHTRNYPIHSMHASYTGSKDIHTYWPEHHQLDVAPLYKLPQQVQILSLSTRPSSSSDVVLRLYRPPVLKPDTKSGVVNIEDLFSDYSIVSWQETSLSLLNSKESESEVEVSIQPTEIITAVIKLGPKSTHEDKNDGLVDEVQEPEEPNVKQNFNNLDDENKDLTNKFEEETDNKAKFDGEEPLLDETELIVPVPDKDTDKDADKDTIKNSNKDSEKVKNSNTNSEKDANKDGKRNFGGKGRVGKAGEAQDVSQKLKEKASRTSNTSGLYTMSFVFYIALLVVILVGGWFLKQKRTIGKDKEKDDGRSTSRLPAIWKEREDSMMKLL